MTAAGDRHWGAFMTVTGEELLTVDIGFGCLCAVADWTCRDVTSVQFEHHDTARGCERS
jgi:hypothetical protein